MTKEEQRLRESRERIKNWQRWGPYLSERSWGTVREDYSSHGTAWEYFPYDHARSRAYRWCEDGLGGICDRHQFICLALAVWNGRDPMLKERLFGLTGHQGNHGEDVKEYYFYLDSTPTHSYMKYLYKYPQAEFPYERLIKENLDRGRDSREYELIDTGVFEEDRYFDVFAEYAKLTAEELLIRIHIVNRGPGVALVHLLPTIWFRNTWSWGLDPRKPHLRKVETAKNAHLIELNHNYYGRRWLWFEGRPPLLFTENNTNRRRLWGIENESLYVKDGINDYVVHGVNDAVNPEAVGTKGAAQYVFNLGPDETATVRLRLTDRALLLTDENPFDTNFDLTFQERQCEADEFYNPIIPAGISPDTGNIMRQAISGLLWSKQFYAYEVRQWLNGDPVGPVPPPERLRGRNHEWTHLYNSDVISMPDKWEFPWYAAWDLAFNCVNMALVDSDFAKEQLVLLLREWYMHPNGQLPAYEWALSDVNPPVHAWAAWRVYKIEKKRRGIGDRSFLERVFHKLLLDFTWWVNRKDHEGRNAFQGGFLGLDNIGIFDRSAPLPTGGHLEQADGTSWMAMYCLNMLAIALELAREDPVYEDTASKFWEHFVYIAHAMNHLGGENLPIWDESDGFYYDVLHLSNGSEVPLKLRSMVGLIPLFAVETLDSKLLDRLPRFKKRLEWFLDHRLDLQDCACQQTLGQEDRRLLAVVNPVRLRRVLKVMLDEHEFFSPYGIRALSCFHQDHPYAFMFNGMEHRVAYEPGESRTGLFGGNSNWRGPIWFPVNFLIIESLQKFHYYLGDSYLIECPTGSGEKMTLWEVATEISRRLMRIFQRGPDGRRPVYGDTEKFQRDPHWQDLVLFYEYFHGDNGAGIGASHQTGWTSLIAKLIQQSGER